MRLALDSNILVYAEGVNGEMLQQKALELISKLNPENTVLPAQTLGELYHVLVKKAHRRRSVARAAILSWHDTYLVSETSSKVISSAAGLSCDHEIAIWDAVVIASAAEAGCRLLLSENMHDGFTWSGITVTNPFASTRHALLEPLLTRPAV